MKENIIITVGRISLIEKKSMNIGILITEKFHVYCLMTMANKKELLYIKHQ
jgi:hypothetical protein